MDIESEIAEAEGYVKAMDVEFRSMPSADKKSVAEKISGYKDELQELIKSFANVRHEAELKALKKDSSARTRHLLSANQKLDNSTSLLERSRMMIAQTELVGNNITADLESQKETLIGAQAKVYETKEITDDARGVLTSMGNRALYHKCCVLFVIVFLAAMIGIVLYFGFVQKKQK